MLQAKNCTLTNRQGDPVPYVITPIRASQSVDIALALLACIAKPGARLIRIGLESGKVDENTDPEEIKALLGKIDWTELAGDAETVLQSLSRQPDLVRRLFHGVFRNNADMSDDAQYDLAYSGNWGEWYAALKEIIDVNGLLPFLDSLSS